MLDFDFLEKDLGIVSIPHLAYDFSRKMFLLYSVTDQILLPDCLNVLRYWKLFVLQLFINQAVTS